LNYDARKHEIKIHNTTVTHSYEEQESFELQN
jgi:hypothetical protein